MPKPILAALVLLQALADALPALDRLITEDER